MWQFQNVSTYGSLLKSGMGRFQAVATKYLDHTLARRRFVGHYQDSGKTEQLLFHGLRPLFADT
jgi:hypothetical protein